MRKGMIAGGLFPGGTSVNGEEGAQRSLRLTGKRWEGSESNSTTGGGRFAATAWIWGVGPGNWAVDLCPGEGDDGARREGARQGGEGGVTVKGEKSCFQINFVHTHLHSLACYQSRCTAASATLLCLNRAN
jgi:hypothetical protein